MKRVSLLFSLYLSLSLAACVSADPTLVARAVDATLTAAVTPTPIVVVVTAVGGGAPILSVTPDASVRQTLIAATETLAAGSATPLPPVPGGSQTRPYTPTATATPIPSASAQPPTGTPAPAESPTPLALGASLYEDDFTQPKRWNLGEDNVQRTAIAGGQLSITLKVADRFTFIYNLTRRARDFYAIVTGAAADCGFRDRYGLLFRVQDGRNYYQFEVDCDGRYRLSKVVDETLTPLRDWTPSDSVRSGSGMSNDLSVRAEGDDLEVFANGQSLWKLTDTTYGEGGFGLYAGSGVSETYTATFDDLRVWEVKK
jgi:hypothetical protein